MTKRIPVNMTLPVDLIERMDRIAGRRNRSAFVEAAVRERLRRELARRAWEDAAGSLRAEDYPEWDSAEKVQEWVRARRREETDANPEKDVSAA